MHHDLTTGKPSSVLWKFCLPLFGSVIFQQLYNVADSFVAGRFIGEQALAAVGNSYEVTLIFIAFAFGCNMGCSVTVAQLFGAKDWKSMKCAVSTAMIMTTVVCLFWMLTGLVFGRQILELLQTPEAILDDSALYLDIYVLGLPFMFFYNLSTGIFSALGDSRTPFFFLSFSSTANILVDILFVTVFHMRVDGVAWATFLCQGISCILAVLAVLRRLKSLPCDQEKGHLFSAHLLKRMLQIAIPSTLQQSFVSVGNLIIQTVINAFGASVIAGYSASVKLNNLVITSFTTLGNGISSYTAQNLGANRKDRIQQGFSAGIRMVWMLCIPFTVAYFFFGHIFLSFFLEDSTGSAMSTGKMFLQILSPFYFIVSAKLVADGILRGTGLMHQFMIATFTDLLIRVGLAIVLSRTSLGATGIWCAWPVGWVIATAFSLLFMNRNYPILRHAHK